MTYCALRKPLALGEAPRAGFSELSKLTAANANEVGAMLLAPGSSTIAGKPAIWPPSGEQIGNKVSPDTYRFNELEGDPEPHVCLRLAQQFAFIMSDFDGWQGSEAQVFIWAYIDYFICRLDGMASVWLRGRDVFKQAALAH